MKGTIRAKMIVLEYEGDAAGAAQVLATIANAFLPKPAMPAADVRKCRECGCTDANCSGCIERTGEGCHWVEEDLCSACVPESMRSLTPAKSARKKIPRRK